MKVTEVKLFKSQKQGLVKAFGKAVLDDTLSLDVIVMDKGEGAWVTFPNGRKGNDGKYYLPVFFKTKEADQEFKSSVLDAYTNDIVRGDYQQNTQPAQTQQDELPF